MHCLMVPLSSYPRQLFITEHIDDPVIAIQRFHFNQCIAFFLGQKLTYDHVLEVLGAVDNSA